MRHDSSLPFPDISQISLPDFCWQAGHRCGRTKKGEKCISCRRNMTLIQIISMESLRAHTDRLAQTVSMLMASPYQPSYEWGPSVFTLLLFSPSYYPICYPARG